MNGKGEKTMGDTKKENDDNPGFGRIYRAFSGLSEYAGTE
jgi:hypothetical protein